MTMNRRARALAKDERGSPMVEFALITPILILVYLATIETSNLVSLYRKNITLATTLSDLVARRDDLTRKDVRSLFEAGDLIVPPGPNQRAGMRIATYKIDENGEPSELWSMNSGLPLPPVDVSELRSGAWGVDRNVVVVESLARYTPIVGSLLFENMDLFERSIVFPRDRGIETLE